MAYMVEDFYRPGAVMEFPKGGSAELIGALERGLTKHAGSSVLTSTPVEEVLVEDGRAVGVRVKGGKVVRAKKAVVSNADLYNTFKLVPKGMHAGFDAERELLLGKGGSMKDEGVPLCKSFMHLHLGIKADAIPKDLPPQVSHVARLHAPRSRSVPPPSVITSSPPPHSLLTPPYLCNTFWPPLTPRPPLQWTIVNSWDCPIDEPGNVIVVSCPSLLDPSLAPDGYHVIHAYTGNVRLDRFLDLIAPILTHAKALALALALALSLALFPAFVTEIILSLGLPTPLFSG